MLPYLLQERTQSAMRLADALPLQAGPVPRTIVAIPARNEEDRIGRCLDALRHQVGEGGAVLPPHSFGVLLLLNNCTDGTRAAALRAWQGSHIPLHITEMALSGAAANAGYARGLALDLAALWQERGGRGDGVLLTSDADSRVASDWIARNLTAIAAGNAGVAGQIRLDEGEASSLSSALRARGRIEDAYERALLWFAGAIDPLPHDPWPNHRGASGASLAVRLDAYRRIGGLPLVASGEDRALAQALTRLDLPVRHDCDITVFTSARLAGRASGGTSDALRLRTDDPDIPGDETLEALPTALRRFRWRARLRGWHARQGLADEWWTQELGVPSDLAAAGDTRPFGALWAEVEAASPHLRAVALRPSQMASQIRASRALRLRMAQRSARESAHCPGDSSTVSPAG